MLDPNSSANFNSFLTTHLHLALSIDFSSKTLKGSVQISFKRLDEAQTIVLDAANVAVKSVSLSDNSTPISVFISFCNVTPP